MEYEWDPAKDAQNRRKHGVGFEQMAGFDWNEALVIRDERPGYGEQRWLAIGRIDDRLYSIAFTRRGAKVRIISLRPASRKERKIFDEPN